jgi:hypothetical protein
MSDEKSPRLTSEVGADNYFKCLFLAIRDRLGTSAFLPLYSQNATLRRLSFGFGLLIPQLRAYGREGDSVVRDPNRTFVELQG